mmetsp:Transcript_47826/g.72929  ORF Transcript_47826/g.72929 Transcript_47826/m.72929 type:complete len:453 (-) Transcript_47826:21-1379(-)|eukprot:CAMPEP_0117026640 /NCGR_PEP_ID=MMETSP0472-20121206/19566_1 /TAXON_ID=693140 ORGANISM="Tiarina fusus, Strain LIS" /NCGR_SAMPLE_ID=MMETSP0472 /ASSEMBLY_ACC=CAM_ASM_000603 /LENGTH=452 /DNA_ID=CAMNT_0004733703 /DNA_START=103 /DNA_END=1461 /DNA_ORIENTATION=-
MRQSSSIYVILKVALHICGVQGLAIHSHLSEATRSSSELFSLPSNEPPSGVSVTRRSTLRVATWVATAAGLGTAPEAGAEGGYRAAKRPTSYLVDSTQPPTLIPVDTVRKQMGVLSGLGQGSGTVKTAVINDKVNLNNILNKAVFGTIEAISELSGPEKEETNSGTGYASFLCMGIPGEATSADVDLATSLLGTVLRARKQDSALGFWFCPLSSQSDLDAYSEYGDEEDLLASLERKGVSAGTVSMYLPLFRTARSNSLKLLALAPETEDVAVARSSGLQNVNPDRRGAYVADTTGFIALSQDPKFRVYSERSLLKDFVSIGSEDQISNFFAERILVHEAAATAVAKYSVTKPDSFVALIAPTPDVRFLQGINGRIPRLCKFFNPANNKVTDNAVTTILLNPTASETLSKSRYLRLEIGTGPETLAYQSKIADYLWFSSSPKVNMIPRLMNG